MVKKVGRNAPCPCGSGKKYKKCCLQKDEAEKVIAMPRRRTAEASVDSLRNKIMGFVEKQSLADHLPEAIAHYYGTAEEEIDDMGLDDEKTLGFMEWFIHDFIHPDYGVPLITAFLESNQKLTSEETQILKDWQKTNLSAYQATEIEEGYGIHVEDIFTGEQFFFHDISLSRSIKQWELLICRKVWVLDEWQVSAVATRLMPTDKKDIHDFIMSHYREYLVDHPKATISEFLQKKGYYLHHFVIDKEMEAPIMPKLVTSHGEEILYYEGLYNVVDYSRVIDKLSSIIDYEMTERKKNSKDEVVHYTFDWLQHGESAILFGDEVVSNGIRVRSFFTAGPGHEQYLLLGKVEVTPKKLKLSVTGERRFKVGKKVLENNLGKAIRHRIDSVESMDSRLSKSTGTHPPVEGMDPEIEKQILMDMYDEHYRKWLDIEIPALGNKTPREASKTAEGRRELEDLLRVLEHTEKVKIEEGEPAYDVSWIRKELDMEKS
jgi:hypothetical protein